MRILKNWTRKRKMRRDNKRCKNGDHGSWLSGWQSAVGGREIRKCLNCGRTINERPVSIATAQMQGRGKR